MFNIGCMKQAFRPMTFHDWWRNSVQKGWNQFVNCIHIMPQTIHHWNPKSEIVMKEFFFVLSCHSWLLRNVIKLTNFFNHFSTAVWHWIKSFSLTVPMQCSLRVLSGTVPVLPQSAWGVPGLRQPQAAWSYASPANLIQWSAREWIPPCP